jgi:uncharacterized cupin superfamily protein
MLKKIEVGATKTVSGSRYPAPFDRPCAARFRRCLGDAAGLTQFGVNLTRLPAGAWSSQRHWHSAEDEFVYVVQGELVLVTECGEEILRAGECAGFPAGVADGHHLQNRSSADALYLEIGSRRLEDDETTYPDIDLKAARGNAGYSHRNGDPY